MPEFRQFVIEYSAHCDRTSAFERLLPFVAWVEVPPVESLHFPCGSPVYKIHPESLGILYRAMGLEVRDTNKAACACMGRLVDGAL